MKEYYEDLGISLHNTLLARPKANGKTKATNKKVIHTLTKKIEI